jgi:hypothetical protein
MTDRERSDNEQHYRTVFGIEPPRPCIAKKAHELALDIRKFEIQLYWHRTAYFWALIAAAYAGYFVVQSSEYIEDRSFIAFVIACIGFVFSVAWFFVNRGSKFWQENWENHVDMLEDDIAGPLYKTILQRPAKEPDWFERHIYGPSSKSVSKINQWVSSFTILIWVLLALRAVIPLDFRAPISWMHVSVLAITLIFAWLLWKKTGTHLGEHRHRMTLRETRIE